MNRLEEIQEIVKNFIYEKQQMKQEITEIEGKRNKIAQQRNKIKFVNETSNKLFDQNSKAEIVELGKQISELGSQSQELQNKLNSRYIEVKRQVNIRIDNLISEGIREIRKIEEQKKDLEESISLYESRKAKYEIQKQEFFARFGRMPELSNDEEKDMEIRKQEYLQNKQEVTSIRESIEKKEEEISELAKYKRAFKNANWNIIIKNDKKIDNVVVEKTVASKNTDELSQIGNVEKSCKEHSQMEIDRLLTTVEEVVSPLTPEINLRKTEDIKKIEEETITLPLMEDIIDQGQLEEIAVKPENSDIHKMDEKELVEEKKNERTALFEDVEIEYIEPLEEIYIDDIQTMEEIILDDIEPIQEVKVEDIKIEEIITENVKIPEIKQDNVKFIKEENEEQKIQLQAQTVKNINNVDNKELNNENTEKDEEEIIPYEESLDKTHELTTFDGKVALTNIIAKFEEKELVYKAQLSNGKEINIYPRKVKTGNIIIKYKENIEEIKENLINYAVAEYRVLDKKSIKKIDPIICEVLTAFAKQYNYNTQSLIYNYVMSFSKYDECEIDTLPNITYNISYMEGTSLSKKEKDILAKICKNAKKNEKIDIVGCNTGFSKIRYILRRTFNTNESNALPEGKY